MEMKIYWLWQNDSSFFRIQTKGRQIKESFSKAYLLWKSQNDCIYFPNTKSWRSYEGSIAIVNTRTNRHSLLRERNCYYRSFLQKSISSITMTSIKAQLMRDDLYIYYRTNYCITYPVIQEVLRHIRYQDKIEIFLYILTQRIKNLKNNKNFIKQMILLTNMMVEQWNLFTINSPKYLKDASNSIRVKERE